MNQGHDEYDEHDEKTVDAYKTNYGQINKAEEHLLKKSAGRLEDLERYGECLHCGYQGIILHHNCQKIDTRNLKFPDLNYVGSKKFDSNKLRMDLIPVSAINALAEVLTYGASKYGENTWQGISKDRYYGALLRHLMAYRSGEVFDKESGLSHLKHAIANVAFLIWIEGNHE